jgi:hypothetical protein
MARNLKALRRVLGAATAMSLIFASSAWAQVVLTSDGPVKLTATESSATITAFGLKVACHAQYSIGNIFSTPHGTTAVPTSELTAAVTYTGCLAYIGETKAPATVTMNGCDEVIHLGSVIGPFEISGTVDIKCPETATQIEIHAYTNSEHKTSICTTKIPLQNGLVSGFVKTVGSNVTLGGPVTGMHVTKTGLLCGGTAETNSGEIDMDAVISGTSAGGAATSISVSH